MKILVTGGNGRIGRFVVEELRKNGHDAIVFDVDRGNNSDGNFIAGDITIPLEIDKAAQGVDGIIHLAAIPSMMPDIAPSEYMNVNVTGTFNVLEAAAKNNVRKAAIAGSDSALGFVFSTHKFPPEYFPIDEEHPLKPQDPYGLSKLIGEELCKRVTRRYGVNTICLRFCWVWFPDTYAHRASIVENPMSVKQMWGYVDVRDVSQACRLAMESENIQCESIFITAEDTFSEEASIELIGKNYPSVRRISNDYLIEKNKSLFDISKARKLLGYAPQYKWRRVIIQH